MTPILMVRMLVTNNFLSMLLMTDRVSVVQVVEEGLNLGGH